MTKSQLRSAVDAYCVALTAIGDTIRRAQSIPSGHVYAAVMGYMSLDSYNAILNALMKAGLVQRDRLHMLTWTGPKDWSMDSPSRRSAQ